MNELPFSIEDRKRLDALKSQLTWQCFNYQAGERFRVNVNTVKQTHTLYLPKNAANNPVFENYILELARCFYAEKYGPIFGDIYFAPDTDKAHFDFAATIIESAQHWFTAIFCYTNFPDTWQAILDLKYQWVIDEQQTIFKDLIPCLRAASYCAQMSWVKKTNTQDIVQGELQKLVNAFVTHDPRKMEMVNIASLANTLASGFSSLNFVFNQTKSGGHWQIEKA